MEGERISAGVELGRPQPSDLNKNRFSDNAEKYSTTNFTSTPFPEEGEGGPLLFRTCQEEPESLKVLVEGISQIVPRVSVRSSQIASCPSRSAATFASMSRDTFHGYPIRYLSEGLTSTNLTTRTISEIVTKQRGLTLTCHKVKLEKKVTSGLRENIRNCRSSGTTQPEKKTILNNICAYYTPGLNAVMGPSGCGKTSLLSALSLRNKKFSGTIRLNGNPAPSRFAHLCGYCIQDDILNPGLTVMEHLWFSLCLRQGAVLTNHEKRALVVDIVKILQLDGCSSIKVGDISDSRLSGGERKRTGIGMELVAAPKILILDEPTSSLDSTVSKCVIQILKEFANKGRTIILSIHQPSSRIFREFDNLTLLAKGRLVYHGSASCALKYFISLGIPHEPHYSPPDFFVDILYGKISLDRRRRSIKSTPHPRRINSVKQTEFSYWSTVEDENAGACERREPQHLIGGSRRGRPIVPVITVTRDSRASSANNNLRIFSPEEMSSSSEEECFSPNLNVEHEGYASKLDGTTCEGMKEHSDVARWLENQYRSSPAGYELDNLLHEFQNRSLISDELHLELISREATKPSSYALEFSLLTRRTLKGSARLCAMLLIMNVAIGLLFGTLYYYDGGKGRPLIQNRLGMFFYLSVHGISVPSMITAKNFATAEKALFEHEMRSGYYRAISFCASRCAIIVLARILSSVALSTIVYWMTGLNSSGTLFSRFVLTAFAAGLACDSVCLLCALGKGSFAIGKSVALMYMSLTSVFAGFLVNLDSTFPWLSWIKYISITRYCFVSWVVGEFSSTCTADAAADEPELSGIPSSDAVGSANEWSLFGRLECAALAQIVSQDQVMIEHWWINHILLAILTISCLFLCYIRMKKMK